MIIRRANEDSIKDKVPVKDQKYVDDGIKSLNDIPKETLTKQASITKNHMKMGNKNAHFLRNDKVNQLSFDVKDDSVSQRGAKRVVLDFHKFDENGNPKFKFAGYTDNHNYKEIPSFGHSDHASYETNVQGQISKANFTACLQQIKSNADLKENEEKEE